MLLISYGTRPEWIKIKPVIDELNTRNIKFSLISTGQHATISTNTNANIIPYAIQNNSHQTSLNITDGSNRLDSIINSILNKDEIFKDITRVMVQGDTASAYAIALAAFHRRIPIIHLEAGLRSYDINNPYPEEFYRRSISSMASIHLCPTDNNSQNLKNEKIGGEKYIVGNTAIDSLVHLKHKITSGGGCLITLHRRENKHILSKWISSINSISNSYDMKFTFITHPNMDHETVNSINTNNIKIISPIPHTDMLTLILKSDIIVSDSGGLQEEASYFRKPIVVCRKETERPEAIGITSFMCKEPSNLNTTFETALTTKIPNIKCPFGDGDSAKKIIDILYE
jgi:UDP-N-acetylglucosamine 2-epimerase (non-hydrolysing)